MALSSRVAFQALANLTSVDVIVSYLNKYDKKYDHLRMQEAVLSRFKGPLLLEFEAVADFKQVWSDLNRLVRASVCSGLDADHFKILDSYCSKSDLGKWDAQKAEAIIEYTSVFEQARGKQVIASDLWRDLCCGWFAGVWDIISGRVKVCECVVDDKYCRDLFVRTHGLQNYCGVKCRRRDGMRKIRSRGKTVATDSAQSSVRI
jgi:hypothetical protein